MQSMSMLERYGPWAVVCGASEGLGAAFAQALSAQGLKVVLIARRKEALEEVAATLAGESRIVVADLGAPDLLQTLESATADLAIGLVVYNAGLTAIGPFLSQPVADLHRILSVNCHGPITVAHHFGPRLRARGRGGLVLMSSLTAFWGSPYVATYGATKAFNLSLGEALWAEWREHGVDVVVCAAGATSTPNFVRAKHQHRSMTAEAVVRETLAHLRSGPSFVPGLLNRLSAFILNRFFSRRLAVATMASQTRTLKR